ncbi:MAG: hypothetical protein K0S33_3273 [Bacteroidetes bacterium]|nr:hypothetical protein [Bacteroidota bacterium]
MKLSHVALGLLVLGASIGVAQENPKRTPARDSSKVVRKRPEGNKQKVKADTTKKIPSKITHDYCPPCGMG